MSGTDETHVRCPAITRKGQPCQALATASGWCIAHSPAAAEWRAKGGRATRRSERALRLLPDRLRPVCDTLERALDEVHSGKLTPAQASAMAALAGALVKVLTAGEWESRIRALEELAAGAPGA